MVKDHGTDDVGDQAANQEAGVEGCICAKVKRGKKFSQSLSTWQPEHSPFQAQIWPSHSPAQSHSMAPRSFLRNLLLLFSRLVASDLSWPHGLDHARLSCPSLSPGLCSHSCPLSDENQQGSYAWMSISGSLAMDPACKVLCSISLPCARNLCVLICTPWEYVKISFMAWGLCIWDEVKDLEVGRLTWIIWMDPV